MASKRAKKIDRIKERKKKTVGNISVMRFLIIYIILINVFVFLYMYKPIVKIINIGKAYNGFVVAALAKILNAVGFPCTYRGFVIMVSNLALDVKFGCNGLEAVMIYSIAVMAYPARWLKKLIGTVVGLLIIQIANFLRMVALVYSGIHFKNLFDVIHLYIAQGVMIALALGVFFMYINYANAAKEALS